MMIKAPVALWLLGGLPLLSCFVACSDNAGGVPGAANGGTSAAGAGVGSSAGTLASAGSDTAAHGGSAGNAGQSSGGGGASGATAGGSVGGGAGAGTGGSGQSAAGTAGSAGAGGGAADPAAELNGASWTMKCSKPDADPGAADRCWLLPPGQDTCPQAGYTSFDKTLHFGGTKGTIYQVTIHFQGTHEAGDYQGGTANPKEFLSGATHVTGGLHTWLSMEVSSPAAAYNPNAGAAAGSVQVYDYQATIPIEGGATIHMKAFDIDCLMHRYCQNGDIVNCKGYVLPPISPADSPIDGSFLQMTVSKITI